MPAMLLILRRIPMNRASPVMRPVVMKNSRWGGWIDKFVIADTD
jgi:hypothetical protein